MPDNYKRIAGLIIKNSYEVASAEECHELSCWISRSPASQLLIQESMDESQLMKFVRLVDGMGRQSDCGWFRPVYKSWIWIFPAIVMLFLGGWFALDHRQQNIEVLVNSPQPDWANLARREIDRRSLLHPANDKATLLLGNDSVIRLEDYAVADTVALDGDLAIRVADKGHIIYSTRSPECLHNQLKYNQFSTPKGGQYRVTLPDGTLVHLNAASTIRYGASFGNETRDVDLEGEAYFTVKPRYNDRHEKVPFIVHVNCSLNRRPSIVAGGKTEFIILGTEFNLKSYSDDSVCHITPLNGCSVIVKEESVKKPGEWGLPRTVMAGEAYARATNGKPGTIGKADVNAAIAWEKGEFCFRNQSLRDILKQVDRWYNAQIIYKDSVPGNFSFTASRRESIQKLLDRLASITQAHFLIKDNSIIVSR